MSIMLGNLSVEQMENRLGIALSDEHRRILEDSRQERVNGVPLEDGSWHCFDIPFMMVCDTKTTAIKLRDIIKPYLIEKNSVFQIGWEKQQEGNE